MSAEDAPQNLQTALANVVPESITVPGGSVWYKMLGTDKPGIPVLAIHGGPGYPSTDMMPLEALSDERPVILWDQLGCGKSPADDRLTGDRTDFWTIERNVAEVEAVRTALNLDEVHIAGFSWGGGMAVAHALEAGHGIRSMTLMGPMLSASRFVETVRESALRLGEIKGTRLLQLAERGDTQTSEYQSLMKDFETRFILGKEFNDFTPKQQLALDASEHGHGAEIEAAMMGESEFYPTGPIKHFEKLDDLQRLTMPVLYTTGREDYMSPEFTSLFHRATPKSEMTVFEASAHFGHFTEQDPFLARLREFLRSAEATA